MYKVPTVKTKFNQADWLISHFHSDSPWRATENHWSCQTRQKMSGT